MAKVWVKSLQCKSSALEDVYNPKPSPTSCKKPILSLSSCGNSSQPLRDVVFLLPKHPAPQPETRPGSEDGSTTKKIRSKSKKHKSRPATISSSSSSSSPSPSPSASIIPTLAELPEGHSSRRIVEIIFGSSWSASARFPGRIEMLFRVHNPPRTASRFDEYRSAVRSLAAASDSRCAVDGNEMMRFHCPPGGECGIYDASVVCSPVCSPDSGEVAGIRTFAGSGGAHESAGGGVGRRSMLVCRVIAGRVRRGSDSEGESVSGPGKGELIVFDARAVLPCFLIIYKVSSFK